MSAANSIGQSGPDVTPNDGARTGFSLPPEIAARYETREIGEGDRTRIGLFLPSDRQNPALEITNDRIVAIKEDPETVATLVKLASHNGWDKIDVEGSPEFRKAVWSAATREGLTVSGYEATFAQQAEVEKLRRQDAERREREAARRPAPDEVAREEAAREETMERVVEAVGEAVRDNEAGASVGPVAAGAKAAPERSGVAGEEIEASQAISAEDRAIADRVLKQGLRALEASGDPRALAARVAVNAIVEKAGEERPAASMAEAFWSASRPGPVEPAKQPVSREPAPEPRTQGADLADLFLKGERDKADADPRLANALRAQARMEEHIAETFQGDAGKIASASQESRQMISDALRRGLDVSVREPDMVRQVEPTPVREIPNQNPEMER